MKMRHFLTIAFSVAFFFYACKKNSGSDNPSERVGNIPGMGDSPGKPLGGQFALPAGITVNGRIFGDRCDTSYVAGSGRLVDVCIALFNNSATDITLTIPAGLVLIAANTAENQHGIVVQDVSVVLKANKLTRLGLNTYCINLGKLPSSGDDIYTLGPVSSSALMKALFLQLKNKKISRGDYIEAGDYNTMTDKIQDIIWNMTDELPMEAAERTRLLSEIPNK